MEIPTVDLWLADITDLRNLTRSTLADDGVLVPYEFKENDAQQVELRQQQLVILNKVVSLLYDSGLSGDASVTGDLAVTVMQQWDELHHLMLEERKLMDQANAIFAELEMHTTLACDEAREFEMGEPYGIHNNG